MWLKQLATLRRPPLLAQASIETPHGDAKATLVVMFDEFERCKKAARDPLATLILELDHPTSSQSHTKSSNRTIQRSSWVQKLYRDRYQEPIRWADIQDEVTSYLLFEQDEEESAEMDALKNAAQEATAELKHGIEEEFESRRENV